MHIGVDAITGVVHSIETTTANAPDIAQSHKLLHGEEHCVWGDAEYQGAEKRDKLKAFDVEWHIALRPGKRKTLRGPAVKIETIKAQVRAPILYK